MSVFPLAKVVAQRGGKPRERPSLIVLHTTGSGVATAEEAAKRYSKMVEYPHYLIGHAGEVLCFAPENLGAAHVAWRPWERKAYEANTWRTTWAQDYRDARVTVPDTFYGWWDRRWPKLRSPVALLESAAGTGATPNRSSVGIEILDKKPEFTLAQITSAARLILDISLRWAIPISTDGNGGLPSRYVLGHEDLCPCRRSNKLGTPWDPGSRMAWGKLTGEIKRLSDLSWRTWT